MNRRLPDNRYEFATLLGFSASFPFLIFPHCSHCWLIIPWSWLPYCVDLTNGFRPENKFKKKGKKSKRLETVNSPLFILAYNYSPLKTGFLQRLASRPASIVSVMSCTRVYIYENLGWKELRLYTQIDRKYFITGTRSFMGMRFFYPVQCSVLLGFCVQWGNRNPRFVCISLRTLHDDGEAAPWFLFLHFLSMIYSCFWVFFFF